MNETQPFISICLPAWNSAKFIRDAIACVFAQTCNDWELVLIDDGSTDETYAIMQEFAGLPRIRVMKNERNLGQKGIFNRCMDEAHGKWIVLLGADDSLVPHTVATLKAELEIRPDTVIWIHNHLNRGFGRPPHLVTAFDQVREFGAMEFAEMVYLKGNIFGEITNFVVRRDAVAKLKPPFSDGTQTVDIRCWMRVAAANVDGRVVYWPEALSHILEHDSSVSSTNNRTGETYVDFFRLPVDLLEVPWRRKILFSQCLRMLWCGLKFGHQLPAGKRTLPCRTAITLLKRALLGHFAR